NLDSATSTEIMTIFQALSDEGQTVIMVTHEPDIAAHADRVIVLRDGLISNDGPSSTVIPAYTSGHGGGHLMPFIDAGRLALNTIRVQKLQSFFALVGVMIGVMFLVAVVAIVEGVGRYMEEDFAGKLLGVNTFTLRRFPSIQVGNVSEAQWREFVRRPRL